MGKPTMFFNQADTPCGLTFKLYGDMNNLSIPEPIFTSIHSANVRGFVVFVAPRTRAATRPFKHSICNRHARTWASRNSAGHASAWRVARAWLVARTWREHAAHGLLMQPIR